MRTRVLLSAVLSLVLGLAACDFGRPPTDPIGRTVTRIVVTPDSVVLDPQQSQQFLAKGITAAGDTVAATVRWSASAGSVSTNGMYTADASLNDGAVTATLSGSQLAGSGSVKKRRVVQVFLMPSSASVQTGSSQQFSVYGRTNVGDSVPVNVSYAATGGTITASGLFSAGSTAGPFRVIAQDLAAPLADSSAVTVTSIAPPPPPPPGTVSNLAVAGVTDSSVTLSFTEVTDGSGQPASYDVRYAVGSLSWGSAASVTAGTCKVPLAGSTIGAVKTCTVLGLIASTAYQFQLIAYRGTLNVNAVFGALSNVASGTTGAGPVSTAPVASVSLSPASVSLLVG
ncbi:MAG TPA: fibronectin type III domain-containing protein, partial [Candidatus Dormibacteraeota bacterium]|nr:fibronectin type III domain-containing protein [Candidatus Dormibacteraeota bacterium]